MGRLRKLPLEEKELLTDIGSVPVKLERHWAVPSTGIRTNMTTITRHFFLRSRDILLYKNINLRGADFRESKLFIYIFRKRLESWHLGGYLRCPTEYSQPIFRIRLYGAPE